MLPQIVEVVKHIHDITEVETTGVAHNIDIETHTKAYSGMSVELRRGLADLLAKFKLNAHRQPDLRELITLLEKYIALIDEWIRFPKIVEIEKEVEKIVERDRPVLIPTADKEK